MQLHIFVHRSVGCALNVRRWDTSKDTVRVRMTRKFCDVKYYAKRSHCFPFAIDDSRTARLAIARKCNANRRGSLNFSSTENRWEHGEPGLTNYTPIPANLCAVISRDYTTRTCTRTRLFGGARCFFFFRSRANAQRRSTTRKDRQTRRQRCKRYVARFNEC